MCVHECFEGGGLIISSLVQNMESVSCKLHLKFQNDQVNNISGFSLGF